MTPFDLPHRATSSPSEVRRQREYVMRGMPLDTTTPRDRKRYAPPRTTTGRIHAVMRGRWLEAAIAFVVLLALIGVGLAVMVMGR